MSLSIHRASVLVFTRGLENLGHQLHKAEAWAKARDISPSVLMQARLAPDMRPLTSQVQIASDMAKGCGARLAGVEVPSFADTENSFAELQERIASTVAFLQRLTPEQMQGAETREISFRVRGQQLRFQGEFYLLSFVLPNFFFHLTTAYAILRHNGLDLGKMDFLGAMSE